MQPAYYEDFNEIKKKIWSMLDDAVTNRSSQFRIPTFICGHNNDVDGRIVVLRKSDQQNNLVQFHSDIRSDKIELLNSGLAKIPGVNPVVFNNLEEYVEFTEWQRSKTQSYDVNLYWKYIDWYKKFWKELRI